MSVKNSIDVRRGEVYRVPRRGKPAAYIKVSGFRDRQTHQPKVKYVRVTRAGGKRYGEPVALRWLQFYGGAWRLPEDWERVG